jgi:hypothetical protein
MFVTQQQDSISVFVRLSDMSLNRVAQLKTPFGSLINFNIVYQTHLRLPPYDGYLLQHSLLMGKVD